MPVTIDTSTASTATAYSNQRKVDRCQNGVLWAWHIEGAANSERLQESYSLDNGATWTTVDSRWSGNFFNPENFSVFIDLDDNAHVVWKQSYAANGLTDGVLYYSRGVPDAGRTAWTWDSPHQITTASTQGNYPDIVACRTPGTSPTEWDVFIVASQSDASLTNRALYERIHVLNDGTLSPNNLDGLSGTLGMGALGGTYSNANHTYPSIDFHHTGDGKTVAGSTPHLYVAWSAGATGDGKGIRFRKATYSAGSWNWSPAGGGEKEIDSTRFVVSDAYWINCLFDGTRVVLVGQIGGAGDDLVLYERDVADTTTTTHVLIDNMTTSQHVARGAATYDGDGNVYMVGRNTDEAVGTYDLVYYKWTRLGASLSAEVVIDSGVGQPYVSAKRGYDSGSATDSIEFIYTDGTASPYEVKYQSITAPVGPTEIATSTATTATAYSNQRKIDRCSNGVLWTTACPIANASSSDLNARLYYSTDNGATWTQAGNNIDASSTGAASYTPNISLFIDLDDYAHVVYKDRHNGFIYYRRGTPNAGRTAWTWSAASTVFSGALQPDFNYPDVVAHREGTGWRAHIVGSYVSGTTNKTYYDQKVIDSAGSISSGASATLGGSYGVSVHTWPSIDFNHTGDSKTVAGSTPHLYVAWSSGKTGPGDGIRFKKAAYSAGSWTWPATEREIDSTRYHDGTTFRWLNCLFDGTRVIIGGNLRDAGSQNDVMLYDRDAADTTTTARELLADNPAATSLYNGSMTYDGSGNVYLLGRNADEVSGTYDLVYRKWTRSGATLGAEVVIDSGVGEPYVSAKRGYSNNRVEWIYTDGSASPYTVTYDSVIVGSSPSVTLSSPVNGSSADLSTGPTFSWSVSDVDSETQGSYAFRRRIQGTTEYEYWNDTAKFWQATAVYNTSTTTSVTFPAEMWQGGSVYEWSVSVKDTGGATSDFATNFSVTNSAARSGVRTKVGSLTTAASTGNQSITGIGFKPKAIIFWTSGAAEASGIWSQTIRQSIGFTAGSNESYSVSGSSQNGVTTSNTDKRMAAKAITFSNLNGTGTAAEADLASLDADGFTLNWTTALSGINVCFLAIGGDDISAAKVINWTAAASTGNKSVTGLGFKPDLVFHGFDDISTALPRSTTGMAVGFGAMNKHGQQWSQGVLSMTGVTTTDTQRVQQTDAAMVMTSNALATTREAHYVSMDSDGFTLNWSTSGGTNQIISLCLKGVSSKLGAFTKSITVPGLISTSTASTATAYSNQRKVARASSGRIWGIFNTGQSALELWYSDNNGETWAQNTSATINTSTSAPNGSIFIDLDDNVYVAYYPGGAYVELKRSVNNVATSTSWGWANTVSLSGYDNSQYPDVVAHREGTGWAAHVVWARYPTGANYAIYARQIYTSTGSTSSLSYHVLGGSYGSSASTYPSVDFNHTGDSKTVAATGAHIYVAWGTGATGTGQGVRFKKANYSAGSWTWGSEIAIDTTIDPAGNGWANCVSNGSDVFIGGYAGAGGKFCVWKLNSEQTSATKYLSPVSITLYSYGSLTWDGSGDLHLFGTGGNSPYSLYHYKWTADSTTFTLINTIDDNRSATSSHFPSAKRGYSNDKLDILFTDGGASPYNVRYAGINTSTWTLSQGVSQAVTGIRFRPRALLLTGFNRAASSSPQNDAYWALGAASSISDQRVTNQADRNGITTTDAKAVWFTERIYHAQDYSATTDSQASLSSFDEDGFTLNWNQNHTSGYEILYASIGDSGASTNPALIDSSRSSTATAYSNQRKVDRCQDGTLWVAWQNVDTGITNNRYVNFQYSKDSGNTWSAIVGGPVIGSSTYTYNANVSFFIDVNDYAHLAYKHGTDGFIYYRRGEPNADRTTWTWSDANLVWNEATSDYPEIVAHREGTDWKAHIVFSRNINTSNDSPIYCPVTISSSGVIAVGSVTQIGVAYGNSTHKFPSIDFHHTGDGKTVADGTPHLYAAWSAGATGAGKGIRFRRAQYSSGTWNWSPPGGGEREIINTHYIDNGSYRWVNCHFDGKKVLIVMHVDGPTGRLTAIYERNAGDTATTPAMSEAPGADGTLLLNCGSSAYDSAGNVYLFGYDNNVTNLRYRKWTQGASTLGSPIILDATSNPNPASVTAKRGYSNDLIEWIYASGSASPYSVKYGNLSASTSSALSGRWGSIQI